jgi:hypothetical protein
MCSYIILNIYMIWQKRTHDKQTQNNKDILYYKCMHYDIHSERNIRTAYRNDVDIKAIRHTAVIPAYLRIYRRIVY